MGNFRTVRSWG